MLQAQSTILSVPALQVNREVSADQSRQLFDDDHQIGDGGAIGSIVIGACDRALGLGKRYH